MSRIELKWTDRVTTGSQTPRRFLDFVIDDHSLYRKVGDLVSPLGWLSAEENRKAVNRLLRKEPADFRNGRTSIFICAECGDLGCGAMFAVIERIDDNIIWRDFGYQNSYDDAVHTDGFEDIGPFTFNATEYHNEIVRALVLKQ